jgi:hypothetical protein
MEKVQLCSRSSRAITSSGPRVGRRRRFTAARRGVRSAGTPTVVRGTASLRGPGLSTADGLCGSGSCLRSAASPLRLPKRIPAPHEMGTEGPLIQIRHVVAFDARSRNEVRCFGQIQSLVVR